MNRREQAVEVVVRGADQLGETPLWCERTSRLWWLDIEKPKLQSFDPETGAHVVFPLDCTYAGSQAATVGGDRLVATDLSLVRLSPETGDVTPFLTVETGVDNRLNDGRVDARGRLWVGSMDNQLHRPHGRLYRVDPDGTVAIKMDGIIVSNGIAFSPDGRTLYVTDTRRHLSFAFDLDLDDGAIFNQRVFADYSRTGERPDGACVDVDGCLWQAFFAGGRLVRYRPDGGVDRTIPLPVTNPTCPVFGGPDLDVLYVTSATKFLTPEQRASEPLAGSVLAIHGVGQGLAEHRFG
ncbi:SMP-30/gluconolactonase/LRE family protein [Amorphus orientalis]|uniref:Sugar lactone lactonase YvrE n=1 Tax=Amorphus orientalis TaxID=649198 RepID=A0AAE3VPT7_9HYPH|nr:SMP-30/gluconolactonase/LRE family protein [Amorphus orientalis]MDQ0315877.1 sugar lactone lactonase YvrE [Amorphus orientalis]